MYSVEQLNEVLQNYVDTKAIPGAALIVTKNGDEVFRGKWGYKDPAYRVPADFNTIYRLCSMTKPITSIAIMQLVEQGKLSLDDELAKYLPAFANPMVLPIYIWANGYYEPSEDFPAGMSQEELMGKAMSMMVPAQREITIRDLLSHCSGLGMGGIAYSSNAPTDDLEARVNKWANVPLDFQPGTLTGYSACVGHDILGRVVEIVSGMKFADYLKEKIFTPLGIQDITFTLNAEQKTRFGIPYTAENGKLYASPSTDDQAMCDWMESAINSELAGYCSGAAGLYASCEEYNKIAKMLVNGGELNGVRVLKPETVQMMRSPASDKYLEPYEVGQVGCEWGLGVILFNDASRMGTFAQPGTFGWSGAYGTYVLVDPVNKVTMTFMTSVQNAGGNLSPVSLKVQEIVFNIWSK